MELSDEEIKLICLWRERCHDYHYPCPLFGKKGIDFCHATIRKLLKETTKDEK